MSEQEMTPRDALNLAIACLNLLFRASNLVRKYSAGEAVDPAEVMFLLLEMEPVAELLVGARYSPEFVAGVETLRVSPGINPRRNQKLEDMADKVLQDLISIREEMATVVEGV